MRSRYILRPRAKKPENRNTLPRKQARSPYRKTHAPDKDRRQQKSKRRLGTPRACVEPSGKPRRNDAGLRVKIRRLSWLAAETAVAVYLNTPRPPGPQPPPQQLLCHFLMSERLGPRRKEVCIRWRRRRRRAAWWCELSHFGVFIELLGVWLVG